MAGIIILYLRLKGEYSPERVALLKTALMSGTGMICLFGCLALMPLNWGLEAVKWQRITKPIQAVNYSRATQSVYSGVCLGNFAPGRATEFVAKILFFSPENRSRITVLHFVNGMFQFSVTVVVGFLALLTRVKDLGPEYGWIVYASAIVGVIMLGTLALCVRHINSVLRFVMKRISAKKELPDFDYRFSVATVGRLVLLSMFRYSVFFLQLALLIYIFQTGTGMGIQVLSGISVYFLITATLPMFSVVEAAIRAAVGLLVFKNSGTPDAVIALCTVLLWLINIVVPSLVGYYFLWRENFDFKLHKVKT